MEKSNSVVDHNEALGRFEEHMHGTGIVDSQCKIAKRLKQRRLHKFPHNSVQREYSPVAGVSVINSESDM